MTREEAIKMLKSKLDGTVDTSYEWCECVRMAINALEQEPKTKTGHWIWCGGSHKCSNCGEYTCFSHKEMLRYCPNCGSKMES